MRMYKCECCNGDINRATMKCDYCGTQYEEMPGGNTVRIETRTSPIETIHAVTSMERQEVIRYGEEKATEIMLQELIHEIAGHLLPYMSVTNYYDAPSQSVHLHADVKMVKPIKGAKEWINEQFH